MKRRNFIKIGAAAGMVLQFPEILGMYENIGEGEIPRRILGKTGEKLSIVGFGGVALKNNGQEFANKLIPAAFNAGINYFDVSPRYGDAQERMGPPLKEYRNNVFLACKTKFRDKEGAEGDLHNSLKLLQTDHFDLYQFHMVSTLDEVDQIFGPKGAMETMLKAKKEGKVKHIGFSAHDEQTALRMMELFEFESILYPINCACWENANFGPQVYETAKKQDMGILALKAVARQRAPKAERLYPNMFYNPFSEDEEIDNALKFTLSKDITATVHAGDSIFMKKTLDFVRRHKTIDAPDEKAINKMVEGVIPVFPRIQT
ncbi:MAG TPA: aldo/keto reductase [Bacteroides sp.]|nr:aldo/keto reductase [Bacteroides sp.]